MGEQPVISIPLAEGPCAVVDVEERARPGEAAPRQIDHVNGERGVA